MTNHQPQLETASRPRPPRLGLETVAALAGTAFAAVLLVLKAMYAGPLWRDEVNTANVAQMSSLKEFWINMSFESFPPLWPLLLRGCDFLGLAGSDAGIRVFGLYVGLFFLASLWLCARWIGCRAPILSIALLGSLPAFIFIVGSNRAYGLASCLLVLSFGLVWRMVEVPSRARIFWAGLACFLFAHCVYYDVVFLCAMLAGGAAVVIQRRQWKTLLALVGIGFVSGSSLAIYLPIVLRGSAYASMIPLPTFNSATLWYKFGEAVTARSSAQLGPNGQEIWLWVGLLLGGSVVALAVLRKRERQTPDPVKVAVEADLASYCVVSMLLGVFGYFAFLLKLHYWTQTWYYVEVLCLCAISLDGLLGAIWPTLRPWGMLRVGFMVGMMAWMASSAWEEAHTRRSNMDLIATILGKSASEKDLIVVQSAWEAITFDRYYHGRAPWFSVPPIDSHKVHRNDLVFEKMNQLNPMDPVLLEITNTLRGGHNVWLVGNMSDRSPVPPPANQPVKWFGSYITYWTAQVTATLLGHAQQERVVEIPMDVPASCFENLPLVRFSGYKTGADGSPVHK